MPPNRRRLKKDKPFVSFMEGGKGNAAEVKIPASTRPVMQNIKPRNPVLLDCGVFPFDRILYFPPFPSRKNKQKA